MKQTLASAISRTDNLTMVRKRMYADRGLAGIEFISEELGLGIKYCEVALSSASTRTWDSRIQTAQKAHDIAEHFVHRFRLSASETQRINQRIVHLKTLLDELQ